MPKREKQAKIVKTGDKIGGICNKIGRTCVEIATTFSTTIAISERIDRICGKTKAPSVRTGSKCDRMHSQGQLRGNCDKIGKIFGTTVKICEAIVVMYEPTARIDVGIVTISKRIDGRCSTIGKT